LLPSQTDKLYQNFSVYSLNPKDFNVEHSKSNFKVTHRNTGFYFETRDIRGTKSPYGASYAVNHEIEFIPTSRVVNYEIEFIPAGNTNIKTKFDVEYFSIVRSQFNIWLKHLAREIKQPDYWSILQDKAKSLPLFSKIDASNTQFSTTELDFIKQRLDET
jgi:hypothetical protein